ncbi:hypothetical protein Ae201684P_013125 [Aphanomyces euteiches]|nr:hypothetical protein Ae201684P_013125 [Aphanomyces euteiches]
MSPTAMSQKTPIMLLDEGNWNQWRTYLRGRLLSKGLWYLVEPAFKTPKSKPSHFRTPARDYDTADSEQTTPPRVHRERRPGSRYLDPMHLTIPVPVH